jgi:hypothetical protein
MKQTAVEWLFEKIIDSNHDDDLYEILEQAKEMEKEQIIDAYNTSFLLRDKPYETADKYYNETYKSKEQ